MDGMCGECGQDMVLTERKDRGDGVNWVCRREGHYCKLSIRANSWFENSRMDLSKVLLATAMWVKGCTHSFITEEADIARQTTTDGMSFCREVCVCMLVNKSVTLGGGGAGKIVEIDESKFGKRKYNKGKRVEGAWVFGGVERDSNKCFMAVVPVRTSETLISVLKEWVLPGSTVMSDCWKAYDCLASEAFVHLTVNHSLTFKDPDTGAHTNSIEGTWGACKRSLKGTRKVKDGMDGYLAEYIWRRCHRSVEKSIT
ncbi:putative transposase-like protein like [Argiope bruennichi]|uniref:Putative transposase-like protein like n=1 Tax=Argiope bruennichi TaxID=94029 RepID=A0A8T0FD09_ARGBR|nr:putative transposase-like protein like [Argiope bruennichi]